MLSILLTILAVIALGLVAAILIITLVTGGAITVIFGDLFVFILLIWLLSKLFKKRRK